MRMIICTYMTRWCENNHILSAVKVENRTQDFHVHEKSDKLFYVVEGSFQLETDDGLILTFFDSILIITYVT